MAERCDVVNIQEKYNAGLNEFDMNSRAGREVGLICETLLVIADLLVDIKFELQRKN